MNANVITATKDCDYRFVSLLVSYVFSKDELIKGCVLKIPNEQEKKFYSTYKQLDTLKFKFVKGKLPKEHTCFLRSLFKIMHRPLKNSPWKMQIKAIGTVR